MIVVRSKRPLILKGRKEREAVVAVTITDFTWEPRFNRYKFKVTDYEVVDKDPSSLLLVGDPLKEYIFLEENIRYRTYDEVNTMFEHFNEPILVTDNFTQKIFDLQNKGLLLDTQLNPIYGSLPEDWELIDTETEVYNPPV